MSKLFNASAKSIQEDLVINGLVARIQVGEVEAGEQFAEIMSKKMTNKVRKAFTGQMSMEDALQEFLLKSWELTEKWELETHGNFMAFLYKSIQNLKIDEIRKENAIKRKKTFEVNGETVSREMSLQSMVGDNAKNEFGDMIPADQQSVEEMVVDRLNEQYVGKVVNDFIATTKGRNGEIVAVAYKGYKKGWDDIRLNEEIAKVLKAEKGVEPKQEAVRQAKTRAMKKIREAILDGKIEMVNQLEWDF